jgi:hypothetical protein
MSDRHRVEVQDEPQDTPSPRWQHVWRGLPQQTYRWDCVPCAAIFGSQIGLRAVGVPWWVCCLMVVLAVSTEWLRTVFPQKSSDKLAWWLGRWRSQRRYRRRGDR